MNKQNLRPCVGGWLLLASGALSIVRTLASLFINVVLRGMPLRYLQQMLGYSFLPTVIYALPLIIIGAVLLAKKQGIPVAIVCGLGLVAEIVYPLLARLLGRVFGLAVYVSFSFINILHCLPYILLALTALLIASAQSNVFKKLWWVSGAVYGALEIYDLISNVRRLFLNGSINFNTVSGAALNLIFGLIAAAGFIFAGQWLANPYRKQPAYRPAPQTPQGNYYQQPQYYQPPQPQYYQPQYQQPVQPAPAAGSVVEELERAKTLLDSGAITQEEYDALKKRLLN